MWELQGNGAICFCAEYEHGLVTESLPRRSIEGDTGRHFLTRLENFMMLSSSSPHRLLALLNQAIHSCKEEERQLEEQLRQYRKLLGDWKTDSCEAFNQDESETEPQESQPSPQEVKEVELLNKVLEKALKVRGSVRTESPKTPPTTQAIPAETTTQEKPVKPLQKLVNTGAKPKTYQVKPPYKTMPEKRRVRGSARPPSAANTVKPPSLRPLTSEKGNGGKDRSASTGNTAKSPPVRPLASEIGKDRSAESKEVSTRTDCTPGNLQPSSVPKMEYVSSTLTATDVKASKQDQRQQKAWTLKDVGSTLKLPIKYQQLYKKNSRLWKKYFEIRARVPASRPSFIQQLQTTFVPESPELSLFEMEEETARLHRGVRRLEEYIDTAKTWRGSGPAHWQHYRTLLMLEAMQDEVAKSYCELQKLGLVAEQYKKWCEKLSINIDYSEVAGCPFEFCTMPSVLVYSHPDELRELTTTHLRVRELQQKIYLQKLQLSHLGFPELPVQYKIRRDRAVSSNCPSTSLKKGVPFRIALLCPVETHIQLTHTEG